MRTAAIGELVAENPARGDILEGLGLDFWCRGERTLEAACAEAGLAVETVEAALAEAPVETDQRTLSMTAMADHIEATHHAWLRGELPRLRLLLDQSAELPDHPGLRRIFAGLCAELDAHMMKEEQILFPICRQLDRAGGPVAFHCGSVANPIAVMEHEHDQAAGALAELRRRTDGFTAPAGASPAVGELLVGLDRLERDLHRHIHKENNVLFPAAARAEAAARSLG